MGSEGLYSVGKEWEKTHSKKQQVVGFAGHSRLSLSGESLAKSSLSKTFQILACASNVTYFTDHQSRVSHESNRKNHFFVDSSLNSNTQSLHKIPQKIQGNN